MIQLRPSQTEASKKAIEYFGKGKSGGLIYGSCGWGKSILIADIASKLNAPVLVLQPRKELLIQNFNKIKAYGVADVEMYSASVKKKNIGNITYATIGSIKDYSLFKQFKYVLIDEAHVVSPKDMTGMYGKFFQAMGNPAVLGLTGTPYRLVQKFVKEKAIKNGVEEDETFYTASVVPLNRIPNKKADKQGLNTFFFNNIIYKIEMMDLMNQSWLVRPEYDLSYSGPFDYAKLKMNTLGSDFDGAALEAFVNSPDRLKNVFQACKDKDDKGVVSNLVFCSSVTQAKNVVDLLKKAGSKADYIASNEPKERDYKIAAFKGGDITHLMNYGILHTGYDHPELTDVTNARPIISPELWTQICGRPIRLDPNNPNKKATITDVAGVCKRLGRAETIQMKKEEGGFRDEIVSEVGVLSNRALFKFRVESDKLKNLAK